ncbi:MAG: DUF3833 domain-containing protein [Rhodobacter sp.]|nr:DUF3833 domain-containing protein [Rhodobacter sp.]
MLSGWSGATPVIAVLFAALVAAMLIRRFRFSFAAQTPQVYAGTVPEFDIRAHLSGPILCEGMIFGPLGRVSSRFVARMQGDWDGDTGTLSEDFTYSSGVTQARCWHLTMAGNGHFSATADDIVGVARGVQSGATVRLQYRIRLDRQAGGHVLDVTDWMYLLDNGSILNKSEMRKFGVKVAELVATMRPIRP